MFVFDERNNWSLFDSYVESVQVYFQKFFQLNQLILLSLDVEQNPDTLNIQILLLWQKYVIYYWHQNYFTFITYRSRHFVANLSTDINNNILLVMEIHICRVNDFSIE